MFTSRFGEIGTARRREMEDGIRRKRHGEEPHLSFQVNTSLCRSMELFLPGRTLISRKSLEACIYSTTEFFKFFAALNCGFRHQAVLKYLQK